MARRFQVIARTLTALMLLVFLAPPNVCLRCVLASTSSSCCDHESCECDSSAGDSAEEPIEQAPARKPCDSSKCPYCLAKNLAVVSSQPVEAIGIPICHLHVAQAAPYSLSTQRSYNIERVQRPPDSIGTCFHPRI